ncbi:MAG: hypothetical protein N2D54_09265, partial [Chloroflexota bacterium]
MPNDCQSDTRPSKTHPLGKARLPKWILSIYTILAITLLSVLSGWAGYNSGKKIHLGTSTAKMSTYLQEQFSLALQDQTNGNLALAAQRLEHILSLDPDNLLAADTFLEVNVQINTTATPTPYIPTLTPTLDLRPLLELYEAAQNHISEENWEAALETLATIRKINPDYETIELDNLIYLSLRNQV